MKQLVVVEQMEYWQEEVKSTDVVLSTAYLTSSSFLNGYERVINLCDLDRHQGQGHYVSMLADARGHHPLPATKAVEDLHLPKIAHRIGAEIDDAIQAGLAYSQDNTARIRSYFGQDPTAKYTELARRIFDLVQIPLLEAQFARENGHWQLTSIKSIPLQNVSLSERGLVAQALASFRAGQEHKGKLKDRGVAVAILYDGPTEDSPSNAEALERFVTSGARLGMEVKFIGRNDIEMLQQFDALFIRDTTNLNHYTYEFSSRASSLGLIVIDDPESILKCNNKVYMHELLSRFVIPTPKTVMVHRGNVEQIIPSVGLPCILKQPDSAFSLGVSKVESETELQTSLEKLFEHSDIVIAQEYMPTSFDWRIGILDDRVLYACQYQMAPGHWQVIKRDDNGRTEGGTCAVPVSEVPKVVLSTALKAARYIGSGLYGVDLKQTDAGCFVMEVNDNPNVDAGNEDGILGDALYLEIMGSIKRRVMERVES